MKKNPLLLLQELGQSIWIDFVRRGMLVSGELERLIQEDGVRGMTSNPTIFEKAIDGSNDYSSAIRTLALEGKSVGEIYQALTIEDIQRSADIFRPVFDSTGGRDGYVSLEVSPHLAGDTAGTIVEAKRLWAALNRPNVMIKIPATSAGLPAIRQLTREGINVNITLLFGLGRYREVAEAYIAGLEDRLKDNNSIDRIQSVASFFLSRIDAMIDPLLEEMMKASDEKADVAHYLHGRAAIASAKAAYQIYKEAFRSDRFRRMSPKGANTQRLLWASTSTKNPEYSDVKYVEPLIGPETINTVPLETLNAYRDHGSPATTIEEEIDEARRVLDDLLLAGINLNDITTSLEKVGIEKFIKPYDRLMTVLETKKTGAFAEPVDRQNELLGPYTDSVSKRMASMEQEHFAERFWRKDPALWKNDRDSQKIISNALGWLDVPEKMMENLVLLEQFAARIKNEGFKHVVHMGMGGSSLAPLLFRDSLFSTGNGLPLTVLDTTDPATILNIERTIPVEQTLFIVASKSGTTTEPLAFGDYFYEKVKAVKHERAGDNFVAITDPGTSLVELARERGFRHVFLNFPDIGGRYSAISYFGLVPAALMGVDVSELLERVLRMKHACASCVGIPNNPGISLGATFGELARQGRDKLTIIAPKELAAFGLWLEQLLAESTGKEGTGILPIVNEPIGDDTVYDTDRVFVILDLDGRERTLPDGKVKELAARHPVITIRLKDMLDLGQEMFRWEIATAVAGSVLGINAFDQPNVQESKDNTSHILRQVQKGGALTEEKPALNWNELNFYTDHKTSDAMILLLKFFEQARTGDYVSIQAYLTENDKTDSALQEIRTLLRDKLHFATTVGYGPRYLHSTGQYHKGGPNNGLFLLLTADDTDDALLPGRPYSFAVLKKAQALGDFEALRKHHRRIVRVDLGRDETKGLWTLKELLEKAILEHAASAAPKAV